GGPPPAQACLLRERLCPHLPPCVPHPRGWCGVGQNFFKEENRWKKQEHNASGRDGWLGLVLRSSRMVSLAIASRSSVKRSALRSLNRFRPPLRQLPCSDLVSPVWIESSL